MKLRQINRSLYRWQTLTLLSLCLLALSFAPFAACKKQPTNSNRLVIGTEKAPLSLDPRSALDTYSTRAVRLIYAGLFRIDDDLRPTPHLVSKYSVSEDGLTYDFWLKPNIKFHDGQALTFKDVVATYRWILNPENKTFFRNSFKNIDKMNLIDDGHLQITLKEPYIPFLTALVMGILPQRFETAEFEPIGTGPYTVATNSGKEGLMLKRFDHYFDGQPGIEEIFLKPVLDDSVRLLGLLKGEIDLIQNAVPPTLLHKAEEDKNITVQKSPGLSYAYLGFNLEDPTLKNPKVRRAIAHAINRDDLIKYKLKGLGKSANTLLAPTHYMANNTLAAINYDPAAAKKLLDEAGLKDPDGDGPEPRITLEYKTSTNPQSIEKAQITADQLGEVGIKVKVQSNEFGVFFADVKKGQFQMYSLQWSQVTSEDIFFDVFHSESFPPNGANRNRYKNSDVDRLIMEGRKTTDSKKRQKIYHEIQRIVHEELPYVSLWHLDNVIAFQNRLKGYQANAVADYSNLLKAHLEK